MSTSRALTLEPGANLDLVEAPIFSETKSGQAISTSPARALIDPGHGYLQQFGNFLHAEERAPQLRALREFCCGRHHGIVASYQLSNAFSRGGRFGLSVERGIKLLRLLAEPVGRNFGMPGHGEPDWRSKRHRRARPELSPSEFPFSFKEYSGVGNAAPLAAV